MLSTHQISSLVRFEEFPRLVDRVLANGRCPNPVVRRQMSLSEVAAPAGLGLGLQRLAELSYGPTMLGQHLVDRLISLQRKDGNFGSGAEPSVDSMLAATGTALAGLLRWMRQCREAGTKVDATVGNAIQRGWIALSRMYGQRDTVENHPTGWSIVAWQLGAFDEFRRMLPVQHLLNRLDQAMDEPALNELNRYAHAAAA